MINKLDGQRVEYLNIFSCAKVLEKQKTSRLETSVCPSQVGTMQDKFEVEVSRKA